MSIAGRYMLSVHVFSDEHGHNQYHIVIMDMAVIYLFLTLVI